MRNPVRYITELIVRIQERIFRGFHTVIVLIIAVFIIAFIFPSALTTVMNSSLITTKTTHTTSNFNSAATTTWASGLTTLIITILPVLVIVAMAIHMFGFVTETNEYGDRVIVRGQNYYQQYEQNAIESELMDMYNYFKSDT